MNFVPPVFHAGFLFFIDASLKKIPPFSPKKDKNSIPRFLVLKSYSSWRTELPVTDRLDRAIIFLLSLKPTAASLLRSPSSS